MGQKKSGEDPKLSGATLLTSNPELHHKRRKLWPFLPSICDSVFDS